MKRSIIFLLAITVLNNILGGMTSSAKTASSVDNSLSVVEDFFIGEFDPSFDSKPTLLWGDVNRDDKVNFKDSVLILQYASGRVEAEQLDLTVSDVNGDEKHNFKDAVLILQKASGRIDTFPVEQEKESPAAYAAGLLLFLLNFTGYTL